ncbi:MAG: thiamine phosphate synthase, partial [Boseongicola sp.]
MSETETTQQLRDRCRLVLVANSTLFSPDGENAVAGFGACMKAGDIASVIFDHGGLEENAFQAAIQPLVGIAQANGVASVVCDKSRVARHVGADGLQLGQDPDALEDAIARFQPAMMVGAGNVKTRHNALVLGEMQPDYLMFGKPGGDTRPEPNPKNIDLGAWWSSMIEIPCIVLGGTSADSALTVAQTGAEFVALGEAVFALHNGDIDFDAAAEAIAHA